MSIVQRCLAFAGLFEAELLTELMLRYWQHPLADDQNYRNDLLESATGVLEHAANGERLLETLAPEETNFVVALWYSEWAAMPASAAEDSPELHERRKKWLEDVRRAIPSCFSSDVI